MSRAKSTTRTLSRRVLASLGALLLAATITPSARADLFGGDVAVLSAILIQAVQTTINTTEMILRLKAQIELLHRMVKTLDVTSWEQIKAAVAETRWTVTALTSGIDALSFQLTELNNSYDRIYPKDYRPIPEQRFKDLTTRWRKETLEAAKVATRSQTVLEQLTARANTAQSILGKSQGSDGQLQQMQLLVQMLGLVHTEMLTLIQNQATEARAASSVYAAQASERAMSEERKRRHREGYKRRGAPVEARKAIP